MKPAKHFPLPISIGHGKNTPNHPNRVHRPWGLDCWLLEYTVAGHVEVTEPSGDQRSLTRGDLFYYRPTVPQYYQMQPGKRQWEHYWVCFVPSENWLRWLRWPEVFEGFHSLHIHGAAHQARIETAFREAVSVTTSHYFHRDALLGNLIEQILLWAETENSQNPASVMDERITRSLAFLDDSFGRMVSVEEMAHAAGLSPSRFAHLFQEIMGQSPLRYAERRRVERAIEFLRSTSDPVSEVSRRLGYQDPLYFSRVFRRVTGQPPSFFRHQSKPA